MNRVELKQDAKEKLNGKLAESIKVLLLLLGISFAVTAAAAIIVCGIFALINNNLSNDNLRNIINIVSDITSVIITSALTFGYTSFFLKISRNEEVTYKELFAKKYLWKKFIVLSILLGLVVVIGSLCFIIPGIILALGLSQALLIILDDEDTGVIDALTQSWEMMNGHKLEYLVLQLSFLGWLILLAFTFGIGYLWLIPYMEITNCNFYNKLKEKAE